MKRYKQLIKELPSKKVVFAFGRFQPPTIGHELLVKKVKQLARGADHVIYTSKTQDQKQNPLPAHRKVYYLQRMFPGVVFKAADDNVRTFMEAAASLNKKYKNIVMVAGSDRVDQYRKLLNDYNGKDFNFDTIEVVSAGERDPDSDTASGMSGTKMREAAKKGNLELFKKGLPHAITTNDAKRLMNEIREGMGLQKIKESIKYEVSDLREQYVAGKIFNIGDIVEDNNGKYEIVDRGANYITVVNSEGSMFKKWLNQVTVAEGSVSSVVVEDTEVGYKGYRTQHLHTSDWLRECFRELCTTTIDPAGVLIALKSTDAYLGSMLALKSDTSIDNIEKFYESWNETKEKFEMFGTDMTELYKHNEEVTSMLEQSIVVLDETLSNKTLKTNDRVKVARMISAMLGNDRAESSSSPEMLVNLGLRKIKTKPLLPMSAAILKRMLELADQLEIKYDKKLVNTKIQSAVTEGIRESEKVNRNSTYNAAKDILRYKDYKKLNAIQNKGIKEEAEEEHHDATPRHEYMLKYNAAYGAIELLPQGWEDMDDEELDKFDMPDADIDAMINAIDDEEIIDAAWDDDEIVVYDDETGEEITDEVMEEAVKLDEILSRFERIKAGNRARRTKAKRQRKLKIALRKASNKQTINNRSRRAAIRTLKKRFARKPLSKLSVSEKERLEGRLKKMGNLVNRLAMRMAPKVRKIERDRLYHK